MVLRFLAKNTSRNSSSITFCFLRAEVNSLNLGIENQSHVVKWDLKVNRPANITSHAYFIRITAYFMGLIVHLISHRSLALTCQYDMPREFHLGHILRTVPTNSMVFLPRFMITQGM